MLLHYKKPVEAEMLLNDTKKFMHLISHCPKHLKNFPNFHLKKLLEISKRNMCLKEKPKLKAI